MAEQIIIPGIGDTIAEKYVIKKELGRGAYGVVFGCEQVDIGRYIAVKTLLPQAFLQGEIVNRFHREAQLISRLDHPNVIRLFDYGVHDGLLYMAVEFVSGETLSELIKKTSPMSPKVVTEIALQILSGLEHAHAKGIVHRDLKPENIIVIEKDSGFEAKILDFGISKLIRGEEDEKSAMNTLTQDGTVLGTPHYMSPENIVGDPCDHRADIYALGMMMYEMVSGYHPFDAPSPSAVFVKHLTLDAPLLEDDIQQSALGSTIFQAIEKQPEDRIQSAAGMAELLQSDTFKTIIRSSDKPSHSKNKVILAGLILGGTIAILMFAMLYFWKQDENEKKRIEEAQAKSAKMLRVEKETKDDKEELVFEDPLEFNPLPDVHLVEALVVAKTLKNQALIHSINESQRAAAALRQVSRNSKNSLQHNKIKVENKEGKKREKAKTILVRFSSQPSGAIVKLNNTRIGKTPLSKTFSDPEKSRNLSFSYIGYKTSRLRFSPNKRSSIHLKLKPKRLGID